MKIFQKLTSLIFGKQRVAITEMSLSKNILDDYFPNIGELEQKLAEVGMGPLLPTLTGIPGKRTGEQFVQVGNPKHKHRFSEVEWPNETLGPSVTDMIDGGYYATFKSLLGCECGALKITSERSLI